MKALDWIKENKVDLNKLDDVDYLSKLMEAYAFEAWKNAENNGRRRLSRYGKLDIDGSKSDFEKWLSGEKF